MNDGSAAARGRCTSLAEGTAGVELAGRAEKATAAEPEALEPGACGKAGRRHNEREGTAEGVVARGREVCVVAIMFEYVSDLGFRVTKFQQR